MKSTSIVPIERPLQEQVIDALITSKSSYSQAQLARMPPGEIDDLLREYYLQASQEGLIILINLAIRSLGIECEKGRFHWEHQAIRAIHDPVAGTVEVRVGDLVVLQNDQPGRELLRPGQWLHALNDAYRQKKVETEWRIEIERGKQHEQKIMDFTTDI